MRFPSSPSPPRRTRSVRRVASRSSGFAPSDDVTRRRRFRASQQPHGSSRRNETLSEPHAIYYYYYYYCFDVARGPWRRCWDILILWKWNPTPSRKSGRGVMRCTDTNNWFKTTGKPHRTRLRFFAVMTMTQRCAEIRAGTYVFGCRVQNDHGKPLRVTSSRRLCAKKEEVNV